MIQLDKIVKEYVRYAKGAIDDDRRRRQEAEFIAEHDNQYADRYEQLRLLERLGGGGEAIGRGDGDD